MVEKRQEIKKKEFFGQSGRPGRLDLPVLNV